MRSQTTPQRLLGLSMAAAAALSVGFNGFPPAGYAPHVRATPRDTLRPKRTELAAGSREFSLLRGAVVPGYLSSRGLPPVRGQFTVTDNGLVFQSAEGSITTFPLVGPQRQRAGRQWRVSTVSLAYTDEGDGQPIYVFRVDAGVFETDDPGPLLEVAAHPAWLDSLAATEWTAERTLVDGADSVALWKAARELVASSYADSLYSVFGRPRATVGLIGPRGRMAGRLGEYIASRDSLALDLARMTGEAQLRHTLAHELAHRWQTRAPAQLATLLSDISAIRDPRRYGYGDVSEHQAEAIAFAINFLQTTAATTEDPAGSLSLLDHYELLVPGTRTMVRYLALQPIYHSHPLRLMLTTDQK